MKRPVILLASLALNLILATALVGLSGRRAIPSPTPSPAPTAWPDTAETPNPPASTTVEAETDVPPVRFRWGLIESADYHQYIANLRAVGCPARLIRDMIIADVTDLYAGKLHEVNTDRGGIEPWYGQDRREAQLRKQRVRREAVEAEQRALLKELLGIEWNAETDTAVTDHAMLMLLLGFVPEAKANQLLALIEDQGDSARKIRQAADNILLDEDRKQLDRLHQTTLANLSRLFTAAEFEELSLRAQSVALFHEGDLHLEGVRLTGSELRQLCQLSRIMKDVIPDDMLDHERDIPDAEQERRRQLFEAEVRQLLGPTRFADFLRAQQPEFREAYEFAQEHHIPVAAAEKVSDALRFAKEQAAHIRNDATLSPDEQTAALLLLKRVTANSLQSTLDQNYAEFVRQKGKDLDEITAPPEVLPAPEAQP